MKKNIQLAVTLLCFTLVWAACEKHDPDFFDEGANGAYFDYGTAAEFDKTFNFSDHIVGYPDTVSLMLKVKLLGYLMDDTRTLAVKTRPIEGYQSANILFDEVVFTDREYEKDLEVRIIRPEVEDTVYGIAIYLDGSADIGPGINGKEEVKLFVKESYSKPSLWESHIQDLLGTWSREKQIFLARHTGDNHFYEKLYSSAEGGYIYSSIQDLNVSAVNALLAEKDYIGGELKDSIALAVDFPILKENDFPAYAKPYFWTQLEEKLGYFKAAKLCRLASKLAGVNTLQLVALCNDDSDKKLKNAVESLHKELVPEMLNEYNSNAQKGYTIAQYDTLSRVKIGSADYSVSAPFWWSAPDSLGSVAVVNKYFGSYERKKYLFILREVAKVDGADQFIAASVFPFVLNVDTCNWDPTPLGANQLVGEERIKECYRIVKAANDKRYSKFDIPEVEL